jgi:hemerythrin superfamily protein
MPTRTHSTQTGKTNRRSDKGVDALDLLKADHRAVEKLFEEYESARKPERKDDLAHKICMELTNHAELEETSFYPAVREVLPEDEDLLNEAEVEHSSLKWLIEQLESENSESPLFDAKVTTLKEYVQHHVKEEEKQMFPKIKKSELDTKELGKFLQERKKELQAEIVH